MTVDTVINSGTITGEVARRRANYFFSTLAQARATPASSMVATAQIQPSPAVQPTNNLMAGQVATR